MKKILVLLLSLQLATTEVKGQFMWSATAQFPRPSTEMRICNDKDGNAYVIGHYGTEAYHSDSVTIEGGFFCKYSSNGTLIWSQNFPNVYISKVAMDNSGYIFIAATDLLTTYISKYNASGFLISKFDVFQGYFGGALDIAFDQQNNYFIEGRFINTVTLGNTTFNNNGELGLFVAKFNAQNTCIWARATSKGSVRWLPELSVDLAGNAYVGGSFENRLVFDNDSINGGSPNGFILKYNSAGTLQWLVKNPPTMGMWFKSLTVDPLGNAYAAFDPIYLSKYNTNGVQVWAKQTDVNYQNSASSRITLNNAGDLYLIGNHSGTVNLGGIVLPDTSTTRDLFIAKYDKDGNAKWATQTGCLPNSYQMAGPSINDLCIDPNNNIFITGRITGTIDFGGNPKWGAGGLFVAKINDPTYVGIETTFQEEMSGFKLFPNPTTGRVKIECIINNPSDLQLKISSSIGNEVYIENLDNFSGSYSKEIDLSKQASGLYFIEILKEGKRSVQKIVVN